MLKTKSPPGITFVVLLLSLWTSRDTERKALTAATAVAPRVEGRVEGRVVRAESRESDILMDPYIRSSLSTTAFLT